jgi:nicotinamide riboside kinase
MAEVLRIAIVGAESTGKTSLSQALSVALGERTAARCTWVPEQLRGWCDAMGRTPRRDEQAAIAASQQKAIDQAAAAHELVVCDTTPLAVAIYSQMLFDDAGLMPAAVAWHRRCQVTLLTAIDLPWVADGRQRDGPHVREPVDRLLRQALADHGLAFSVIAGDGTARLDNALAALAPWLRARWPSAVSSERTQPLRWRCADCDDPDCEHRLLLAR